MNCIWKTFCKARYNPKLHTVALQQTAKDFFKRELELTQILYEKDFRKSLYKFDFFFFFLKWKKVVCTFY